MENSLYLINILLGGSGSNENEKKSCRTVKDDSVFSNGFVLLEQIQFARKDRNRTARFSESSVRVQSSQAEDSFFPIRSGKELSDSCPESRDFRIIWMFCNNLLDRLHKEIMQDTIRLAKVNEARSGLFHESTFRTFDWPLRIPGDFEVIKVPSKNNVGNEATIPASLHRMSVTPCISCLVEFHLRSIRESARTGAGC